MLSLLAVSVSLGAHVMVLLCTETLPSLELGCFHQRQQCPIHRNQLDVSVCDFSLYKVCHAVTYGCFSSSSSAKSGATLK